MLYIPNHIHSAIYLYLYINVVSGAVLKCHKACESNVHQIGGKSSSSNQMVPADSS